MKPFMIAFLIAASFSGQPSFAADFDQHIVVILDDSGTTQDASSTGTGDLPLFWETRWQYIHNLHENAERGTYVTIVSVIRPQVIWQGPANEIMARNNKVLAGFLTKRNNLCPDFVRVGDVLKRVFRVAPVPPTEMVFISSLIHSQGPDSESRSCNVDRARLQPPEAFFETLRELYFENSSMPLTFYWAYNDFAGDLYDWFADRGVDARIVEETAAYAEVVQ